MKIKVNGKYNKDYLLLGVATNKGNIQAASEKMAIAWSPKNAKSFDMIITHTDYEGRIVETKTGYANIKVSYFTTPQEGKYVC